MNGHLYWVHLPNADIKTDGYIGVSKNFIRRWREHKTKKHCKHFANAIDKYGDKLEWEVLFSGPLDGCYQLEEYFRPRPGMGWNIAKGGTSSNNLDRKLSKETKNKISNATKGRVPWNKGKTAVYSQSSLDAIGKATKKRTQGKDNPMYGKTHSVEAKKKISKTHKGKEGMKGKDNPSARKVVCNETSEVFDTISEASASVGATIQALSMHLRGKSKSCKKLTWRYLN